MTELELFESITSQSSENGYDLPVGYAFTDLLPKLLHHLGNAHGKSRELSYTILNNWVGSNNGDKFSDTQLIELAEQLAENLFVGLGEKSSDSVFLRAYSSLILSDIIGLDIERTFLTEIQLNAYLSEALRYFENEDDFRALVSAEKGWAFAIAHATDLFMYLAKHPQTDSDGLQQILEALSNKLRQSNQAIFLYNEDERFAIAAVAVLKREKLEPSFVTRWLERLTEAPTWQNSSSKPWQEKTVVEHPWWPVYDEPLEAVIGFKNIQAFVRSLYFQLRLGKSSGFLDNSLPAVERSIKRLDTGFLG